jgi:hypothetical protein
MEGNRNEASVVTVSDSVKLSALWRDLNLLYYNVLSIKYGILQRALASDLEKCDRL